jgi:hypothetical protein
MKLSQVPLVRRVKFDHPGVFIEVVQSLADCLHGFVVICRRLLFGELVGLDPPTSCRTVMFRPLT